MISVQMRDENFASLGHPKIAFLNLDLRSLTAIEEPDLPVFQLKGCARDTPDWSRETACGPEKSDLHRVQAVKIEITILPSTNL